MLLPMAMDRLLMTVRLGLVDAQLRTDDDDGRCYCPIIINRTIYIITNITTIFDTLLIVVLWFIVIS